MGFEFVIVCGLCLLLCGGCVCYCVGIVFVIVWGLCLLLCGGCVIVWELFLIVCGFIRDCLICGCVTFIVSYFGVSALCLKCTEHGCYSCVFQ